MLVLSWQSNRATNHTFRVIRVVRGRMRLGVAPTAQYATVPDETHLQLEQRRRRGADHHASPSGLNRHTMGPQDWAFFASALAALFTVWMTMSGNLTAMLLGVGATVVSAWASHALSRRYPRPMPYFFWWGLLWPRSFLAPSRLKTLLDPRVGERMLELGPGIGVHALPVAAALAPGGRLDVLDIQPRMLTHLAQRAARAGVVNIVATIGDVHHLPYPSASFDGAYLIDALGEMPNPPAVLQELRRVLRPGGRLVIGEHFVDPDFVSLGRLKNLTRDAGFAFERRTGPIVVYLARFNVFRPLP
jgi:SAM-dependent methyltransferase